MGWKSRFSLSTIPSNLPRSHVLLRRPIPWHLLSPSPTPTVWGFKPRPSPPEWMYEVTATSPESLVAAHTASLTPVTCCRLHGERDSERSSALLMSFRLNVKGKKKKKENAKCIRKVKRGDASGGLERWDTCCSPAVSSGITYSARAFPGGTRWRSAANKSSSFLLASSRTKRQKRQ